MTSDADLRAAAMGNLSDDAMWIDPKDALSLLDRLEAAERAHTELLHKHGYAREVTRERTVSKHDHCTEYPCPECMSALGDYKRARELEAERDAAIRERDEARAQAKYNSDVAAAAAWIAGRDAAAAVSDRTCAGHLKAGEEQHDEALVNMHATAAMTAGVIDAAIRALEPPEEI